MGMKMAAISFWDYFNNGSYSCVDYFLNTYYDDGERRLLPSDSFLHLRTLLCVTFFLHFISLTAIVLAVVLKL